MTKNRNDRLFSVSDYNRLRHNKTSDLSASMIRANSASLDENTIGSIHVYKNTAENANHIYAHDSFDILFILNEGTEITVCSENYRPKTNSIVFIAPGVPYSVCPTEDAIVPVVCIDKNVCSEKFYIISCFDGILPRFFANAMWGDTTASHIIFNRINNPGVLSLLLLLMNEELSPNVHSETIKIHLMVTIIGYLSTQTPSTYDISPLKITRSEQVIKILTYIRDNYRSITLEKLAENFHYTVPYVSKLVRNATGMTFTDILREIKFEVCLSLLMNSDLKINKIAEIAGFQNTDHFNRIFKKRMGQTPTDYKKACTGSHR